MLTDLVVLPSPSLDQDLGLLERVEDLSVQELVAKLPVERLDVAVLPWTPALDEERPDIHSLQPISHSLGREFGAVV